MKVVRLTLTGGTPLPPEDFLEQRVPEDWTSIEEAYPRAPWEAADAAATAITKHQKQFVDELTAHRPLPPSSSSNRARATQLPNGHCSTAQQKRMSPKSRRCNSKPRNGWTRFVKVPPPSQS